MKTEFLKQFYKDLDKLESQDVSDNVANIITNVEKASKITEIKNLKKLIGYKSAYRIRTGNYRIGIFINKGIVEFVRIVHRKDIYNLFP